VARTETKENTEGKDGLMKYSVCGESSGHDFFRECRIENDFGTERDRGSRNRAYDESHPGKSEMKG